MSTRLFQNRSGPGREEDKGAPVAEARARAEVGAVGISPHQVRVGIASAPNVVTKNCMWPDSAAWIGSALSVVRRWFVSEVPFRPRPTD